MMKKMFSIVAALLLGLAAEAKPVKSMIGTECAEMQIEEEEQNLWVWPTEWIPASKVGYSPSTVRNLQTGVWYIRFSANGYSYYSKGDEDFYSFNYNSFHSRNSSWYAMVQFFLLEEGTYEIEYDYLCETYSDNPILRIMEFVPNGTGWVYYSYKSINPIWRIDNLSYKTELKRFSVPSNVMTGIWLSGASISAGRQGVDVWDVVLKKID